MRLIIKILLLLSFLSSTVIAQRTTATGIGMIKYFEGLQTKAYLDPADIWTVGYGHTGRDVFSNQVITEYQAEQLLIKDLAQFERYVSQSILRTLRWHEFDALVSFSFNLGYRLTDGLRDAINIGNTKITVMRIKQYNKAKVNGVYVVLAGLVKRRAAESFLYENPKVNLFEKILR